MGNSERSDNYEPLYRIEREAMGACFNQQICNFFRYIFGRSILIRGEEARLRYLRENQYRIDPSERDEF